MSSETARPQGNGSLLFKTSSSKIIVVLVILITITLVISFLQKSKPRKPTSVRVYTNEKVTESEGTLVEGFPDIPVYPGFSIDKTYKKEQSGKTDYLGVWFYQGDIGQIMKWYADELKKSGWSVNGPFMIEGEDELEIDAENLNYRLRIFNAERKEGDTGTPGKLITAELIEK